MLTLIHQNPALINDGVFHVDRKFLDGMRYYAESLNIPLTTIHPVLKENEEIMDRVSIPLPDLNFNVVTVADGGRSAAGRHTLETHISKSAMVYGAGMGFPQIARRCRVPYILTLECDLATNISVATNNVTNPARRLLRSLRAIYNYYFIDLPSVKNAYSLHCNGYPAYEAYAPFNGDGLLYLDSRMSSDQVISEFELKARLSTLCQRGLRLLYSGRYEPIKGAVDAVSVAIECQKLGLEIEFHSYGQGSLRDEMKRLAQTAPFPELIFIHDAIPYPDLVKKSREFDLFVCCHVQNDPSCTYLETHGSGLPIVGYDNKMLKGIVDKSKAGFASKLGSPVKVARQIEALAKEPQLLAEMSMNARAFSLEHVFENEFDLRISAIKAAYASLSPTR